MPLFVLPWACRSFCNIRKTPLTLNYLFNYMKWVNVQLNSVIKYLYFGRIRPLIRANGVFFFFNYRSSQSGEGDVPLKFTLYTIKIQLIVCVVREQYKRDVSSFN